MKLETKIRRIINSDKSDTVKAMKLWGLAAEQVPGSNAQKTVSDHWKSYFDKARKGE